MIYIYFIPSISIKLMVELWKIMILLSIDLVYLEESASKTAKMNFSSFVHHL